MSLQVKEHEYFMREALKEAEKAYEKDEVPIGCVIVHKNKIIARGHNLVEQLNDVTAHAEMQAITSAENYIGGKYLHECDLYVTIEPCVMCAGALHWAQINNIIFGAHDSKKGYSNYSTTILYSKIKVISGILAEECKEIIQRFFQEKRKQ